MKQGQEVKSGQEGTEDRNRRKWPFPLINFSIFLPIMAANKICDFNMRKKKKFWWQIKKAAPITKGSPLQST